MSNLRYVRKLDKVKHQYVSGVITVKVPAYRGFVVEFKPELVQDIGIPLSITDATKLCTWKPGQPEPENIFNFQ
jgi:hypothetical protein